jgi:hypothetical protein
MDTLRALVVQDFEGVAVEDGTTWAVKSANNQRVDLKERL